MDKGHNGTEVISASGNYVRVSWAEWEDLLVRGAAIEQADDPNAMNDCAELLCRPVLMVRARYRYLVGLTKLKVGFDTKRVLSAPKPPINLTPPFIRPLTPTELMCGKARPKHVPIRAGLA